ncbi:hypothetical protein [Terracoccus sp. 273MFTsu3.1]|uniref:hypothetical protein n=1 Tax=Terracoccus sp. 273MFTsu3.1 TaxID=1172188 RepID=UPI0003704E7A|nr:hypothetical protein [Terracoccus sp. 273MFTsu3.1]
MIARLTAASVLAAAAALLCTSASHASPVLPEPGSHTSQKADIAVLLRQLQWEYAHTGDLRTHNEIVLLFNESGSEFL